MFDVHYGPESHEDHAVIVSARGHCIVATGPGAARLTRARKRVIMGALIRAVAPERAGEDHSDTLHLYGGKETNLTWRCCTVTSLVDPTDVVRTTVSYTHDRGGGDWDPERVTFLVLD